MAWSSSSIYVDWTPYMSSYLTGMEPTKMMIMHGIMVSWYHGIYERLTNDGNAIAAVRYIQYWSELRLGTIGLRRPEDLAQFERGVRLENDAAVIWSQEESDGGW